MYFVVIALVPHCVIFFFFLVSRELFGHECCYFYGILLELQLHCGWGTILGASFVVFLFVSVLLYFSFMIPVEWSHYIFLDLFHLQLLHLFLY